MKITDPVNQLDAFTLGYCAILLAGEEVEGKAIVDLPEETIEKIIADCQKFQSENADLLTQARSLGDYASYDDDRVREAMGSDFCFTRNGEGVGYWDRNLGELGDKLTEAADKFGECYPYLGDDGKVYLA